MKLSTLLILLKLLLEYVFFINLVTESSDTEISSSHLIDIFRGAKHQKIIESGHDRLSGHGFGKSMTRTDVERITHFLVNEKILKDNVKRNRQGFVSSKIALGINAHNYKKPITFRFHIAKEKDQVEKKRKKKTKISSEVSEAVIKMTKENTKQPTITSSLNKRNQIHDDAIDFHDDFDDFDDFDFEDIDLPKKDSLKRSIIDLESYRYVDKTDIPEIVEDISDEDDPFEKPKQSKKSYDNVESRDSSSSFQKPKKSNSFSKNNDQDSDDAFQKPKQPDTTIKNEASKPKKEKDPYRYNTKKDLDFDTIDPEPEEIFPASKPRLPKKPLTQIQLDCITELKSIRTQFCKKSNIPPGAIVNDSAINELILIMPVDYEVVQDIIKSHAGMYNDRDFVGKLIDVFRRYGSTANNHFTRRDSVDKPEKSEKRIIPTAYKKLKGSSMPVMKVSK